MTALNALVRSDRVHLMTDGAAYSPDGAIEGSMSKVHILAHLPAALSFRGPVYFWSALVARLDVSGCRTFDELLGGIADEVRMCLMIGARMHGPAHVEVIVAGWSHERDRPECYLIDSKAGGELTPAPDGYFSPMEPALQDKLTAGGWQLYDERNDARALLDLMRHQRAERFVIGQQLEAAPLGVFAQHTILTRDGVTSRIVQRWPEDVA